MWRGLPRRLFRPCWLRVAMRRWCACSSVPATKQLQGAAALALLAGYCYAAEARQLAALEQEITAAVAGSLPSLLLPLDSSLHEAQQAATDALLSFATHSKDAAAAIMAAGGVPALVRCLQDSPSLPSRAAAAYALNIMCKADPVIQHAFVEADAAAALMPLLASGHVQARRLGAWGLQRLMWDCPEGQQAAEAAGAVPALAQLLASSAK